MVKELTAKVEPKLQKFDELIKANGGKYLVGQGLTWADIYLAHMIQNTELVVGANLAKNFGAIQALVDNVFNRPDIKSWVENRPKTAF